MRGVHLRAGDEVIHGADVIPKDNARPGSPREGERLDQRRLLGTALGVQPLRFCERKLGAVPSGFDVGVQHRPPLAEHQGIDGDNDIATPDQRRGGGPSIVVLAMILSHGGVIRPQVHHLFLAKHEHAAVRMKVHHRGCGLFQVLRNQHIGRHAHAGSRGKGDLLAHIIAAIATLQHLGPRLDRFRAVEDQVKDALPGPLLKFVEAPIGPTQKRVRGPIAARDPLDIRQQAAQIRAGGL